MVDAEPAMTLETKLAIMAPEMAKHKLNGGV